MLSFRFITTVVVMVSVITWLSVDLSEHGSVGDSSRIAHAMESKLEEHPCTLSTEYVKLDKGMNDLVRSEKLGQQSENLQQHARWCHGYVTSEPTYCLLVEEEGVYRLEAVNAGELDAVFMLMDPERETRICDDDSAGNLLPALEMPLEPGVYELYVGAYQQGKQTEVTVTFSSM